MKNYTLILSAMFLLACNSSNENQLNKQEEKAVETQMAQDQAAMDSLEKAIQAQINETPTDSVN